MLNKMLVFLVCMALNLALLASEPQFVIPDATIDQNFKNAAAEIKVVSDDLASVIASTGALQATLNGAAQLASTQTFTGINTFVSSAAFSGNVSTITFHGWVDIGWERNSTDCGIVASCTSTCSTGKKLLGGGVNSTQRTNLGGHYPSADNIITCYSDTNNIQLTCYSICARIK